MQRPLHHHTHRAGLLTAAFAVVLFASVPAADARIAYVKNNRAFVANDDASAPQRLVRALGVELSADGAALAAVDATGRLRIVNLTNGSVRLVGLHNVRSFDWGADRRLFVSTSTINAALVHRIDGGAPPRLIYRAQRECGEAACDHPVVNLTASPDGKRVVVSLTTRWALTVLNPRGTVMFRRQAAALDDWYQVTEVAWAANSQAFATVELPIYSAGGRLTRWTRAGVRRVIARTGSPGYVSPSWSPDGTSLAFGLASPSGESFALYRHIFASRRSVRLKTGLRLTNDRSVGPWLDADNILVGYAGMIRRFTLSSGAVTDLVATRGYFDWQPHSG